MQEETRPNRKIKRDAIESDAATGRHPTGQAPGPVSTRIALPYVVALAIVAILIVAGQVLIQYHLERQEKDSHTVNVAGRQRMLSQKIAKDLLQLMGATRRESAARHTASLKATYDVWTRSHLALRDGDAALRIPGDNSAVIERLFAELEPHYRAIETAVAKLLAALEAGGPLAGEMQAIAAAVSAFEGPYLAKMDEIVATYDEEAKARVISLRRVELALMIAALSVLTLEALFIFRPALRRIRETMTDLEAARATAEHLAQFDGLTGIANRRHFDTQLAREARRAGREARSLAIVLIDVNKFKEYNDALGHQKGDECLTRIAQALAKQTRRPADLIARYGGDEFVALLPDIGHDGAARVAKAMQDAVRRLEIAHPHPDIAGTVKISVGVGAGIPTAPAFSVEDILWAADKELFSEKRRSGGDIRETPASLPPAPRLTSPEPAKG